MESDRTAMILIVEDEPKLAALLADYLKAASYQTHIIGDTTGYRLDLQGANACPQRMIFEGDRRSKHRHQAITGEFIERALIPLNDCGRPVE